MPDRAPLPLEVIGRRLELVRRALAQPGFARAAEFQKAWDDAETAPVIKEEPDGP